jgi:hypothetical protein
VILVDGLHHYEQAKRDAANALTVLRERGWGAFHDFLPRSWKEHHVPRLQNVWTGDCRKLVLELADASGLEFEIISIGNGVGVMRKVGDQVVMPDLSKELLRAEIDAFVARFEELPAVDWREGWQWIMRAYGDAIDIPPNTTERDNGRGGAVRGRGGGCGLNIRHALFLECDCRVL